MSLRARLALMIGLTMLLIMGSGFALVIREARQSVRQDAQATVNLALQLVETGAGPPVVQWLERLRHLDNFRHLRIDVTGPPAPALPLPAINDVTAAVPGWFRWAVAPAPIRVEVPLRPAEQPAQTLRIEAHAEDELLEAWTETRDFLLVLMVLTGTVYGLIYVIAGRAFRPVTAILEGLATVEQGRYDARLPHFSLPEFDRIAKAFNHMAQALAAARDENQTLIRQSLAIQEDERRHLARELHDEFGQCLTAIKVISATLRQPGEPPEAAAGQVMTLCDRLFGALRDLIRRLRPMLLEDLGLTAALEDLAGQWQARHPELAIHFDCAAAIENMSGDCALQIYRIIQECLTNVVKHAGAGHCWIRLAMEPGPALAVLIRDDGRGFDPNQPHGGFGLSGIRERIAGLGGQLTLETQPGHGVTVRLRLPYPSATA